jgi:hypothetical protein
MMSAQRQEMLEEMPKGQEESKEELVRCACSKSKMNLLIPGKGNARTESEDKAGLEGNSHPEKKEKHGPPLSLHPHSPRASSISVLR